MGPPPKLWRSKKKTKKRKTQRGKGLMKVYNNPTLLPFVGAKFGAQLAAKMMGKKMNKNIDPFMKAFKPLGV